MIDDKIIELINKELDGVISAKEKNKLEGYLEKHPEAKQYQTDLLELSKMLAKVEKVDPDPNLKKTILNTIPSHKYAVNEKRNLLSTISIPVSYKYALSFSAGIIAGLFIFFLFGGNFGIVPPMDHTDLTGSILLKDETGSFESIDKIEISEANIHANIASKVAKGLVLIEANISTISETEFTLQFDSDDLLLDAFRHSGDTQPEMVLTDGRITFTNSGENRFAFVFKDLTSTVSHITFKVDAGTLPYEKTISSGKVK